MNAAVVMPAHDEATLIGRSLRALLADAAPGEFDVVVVANGCTDDTAAVARDVGGPVRVVELAEASKAAALRAGDAAVGVPADARPVLYVDADVVLPTAAARALVAALAEPGVVGASTSVRLHLDGASTLVRSYFRVWSRLPSIREGLGGRGVYALSAEGRARFGAFPDIIADDRYVDLLVGPDERRIIAASSEVTPPSTLRSLVSTRVRTLLGNLQLESVPGMPSGAGRPSGGWRGVVRDEPARVVDLPAYLGVNLVARLLAHRRLRSGRLGWSRDQSSRGSGGV
ncbi:MAG: glycosyltransferase [Microthrixaceae bacterium]